MFIAIIYMLPATRTWDKDECKQLIEDTAKTMRTLLQTKNQWETKLIRRILVKDIFVYQHLENSTVRGLNEPFLLD